MSKWMILTPGRTGSTFIAESISCQNIRPFGESNTIVDKNSINNIFDIVNIINIENLNYNDGDVWHSHNLNSLNFVNNDVRLIISTRSISQAAISHEVAKLTNIFHYKNTSNEINYQRKYALDKMKPFEIAPVDFINRFNIIRYWYLACKKIIDSRSIKYTTVDYSEFETDNNKLFQLLNLQNPNLKNVATKIPYNKEYLVTNLNFLYGLVDSKDDSAYNIMTEKYE